MNTPSTFTRFNNSTTSKSTISFSSSIQNSSIPPPHNPANNGLLILSSIPITDKILHIFSLFVNSSYLHFQKYSKLFMNTSHSHEYGTTTTVHHERMTNIIESSQSFRQIMNTYLENLVDDEISKLCTTEELDQLDVIIDVINDIHKLWLATEILLLSPSETISTDVVTWLQSILDDNDVLDITDPSKSYESSVLSTSDKYTEYWILIFDLVLRGKLDLAWQMLLTHPEIISREDSQEVMELESIFQSHPLLCDAKSLENTSFRTTSISQEKSDEWLHWRQRIEHFHYNRHFILCQTIPELSFIFNVMRGQLKDLYLMSTITNREEDWKTDSICNLLYCHPSTTRNEIIFSIEESMKRVHMPSDDHPGSIVKALLHSNIAPLLETIFQRLSTPIPHLSDSSNMDVISSFSIDKILKASVLLITTQLCHLFQVVGLLDSPFPNPLVSHRKVQMIQRDFVESTVELTIDSLLELNIPIEICVNYLITLIPTRGKEKSKNILLNSQILSDEEAFYTSNLLRSLGLTQEAHSVLVQRGLYWLKKSLRQPSDSTSQLYRKGGMETKALSFFINGLDGRRARSLIDHSLRRCMVALTQSPHLISHLHVKYQSIEEILPSFPEAIHETATKEIQLHSQVISNPLVEINISSGLICAIDETIGVTLCGPEGVFLRYYIEATQTLVTLFQSFTTSSSIATTSATPSSENYEEILHHLHQLTSISIPLKFLIGPSQSLLVSTPPTTASTPSITPFTCQLSCLGRYYLHIIDLIILIDQFYNLKYEQLDKIITDNYFSPVEYDHITAQYNSLVIILFQKKEMEVLLQMVQSLSNNCYLIVETNNYHGVDEHGGDEDLSKRKSKRKSNIELLYSELYRYLLTMYQSSIYVDNYEQYDTSSSSSTTNSSTGPSSLKNKNQFTLFHLKNLRSSLNMMPMGTTGTGQDGNEKKDRDEERKTTLKLILPSHDKGMGMTSSSSSHDVHDEKGAMRPGYHQFARNKSNSLQAKLNQYLTVAPSSISYRLMK